MTDAIQSMNIEELETRSAEIRAMDLDELDEKAIGELSAEIDAINQRRAQLKETETQRETIRKMIASEEVKTEIVEDFKEEETRTMSETNREYRNSKEYIDAFAKYIKTEDAKEVRKIMTSNADNGSIPVPTFVEGIVKGAWERDGIMSLVRKTYLKGNIDVGFEVSGEDALIHNEGADAPKEEDLVIGIVSLIPKTIKKWITVTDEVLDNNEAFLTYLYEELTYRIAKKAADELIAKIEASGTVSTTTSAGVPAVTQNTIQAATIVTAAGELSDDAADPIVVMNRKTYAAFKAIEYAQNYGRDIFEGMDVKYNNTIKSYNAASSGDTYAIVGDFGWGAQANFPNGDGITFKYDDLSLAEQDLVKIVGRLPVALGIVAPQAFVKIVK